ncbi:T9SS C-terminal target domain-containing protein [Epilithonimonas vandammei]|uniref:T9SS C-terminal target domain-containing protein n=2 Tax=Epilithonimonas vandammei TaxID=2487072 RepID=A0A3G8ZH52_9FLAO|nr:T9SS C-terminal target domain-containing protein [Epilithonimonas vandammei]
MIYMRNFYRKIAILVIGLLTKLIFAQSYTQNFDDITTLAGDGWVIQNNSTPVGSLGWFQGTDTTATPTPGPFNSYNGATNSYIAANFNSTGNTGTISNWLITPNRTLRNGDVFTFYTRKPTINAGQTDYPDRLEVRMSTNGASTNVGAGATAVGDFTTLLLSINPTLVANIYPQVWTQYNITVSGLPAPTSGRIAFRYFVTGAGAFGTNSDYIGIDNVVYTPYVCPAFTMTTGGALTGGVAGVAYSTTLSQTGALGSPNFAIMGGALPPGLSLSSSGTISGTPTATGTFIFMARVNDASGCSASQIYSITVQCPTNPITMADFPILCSNGSVYTLIGAFPTGGTYSGTGVSGGKFDPAAGTQIITYKYTDPYGCTHFSSKIITVNPELNITTQPLASTICAGSNTTFTAVASNATGYQWQVNTGSGFTNITDSPIYSGATTSSLTVTGATANMTGYVYRAVISGSPGCSPKNSNSAALTVSSVSGSITKTDISCNGGSNGSIFLTPSGGVLPYTFEWNDGVKTQNRTGLAPGVYTVTIKDVNGCTGVTSVTIAEPTALVATAGTITNVACNGSATGSATVNVTGGTGSYTYAWNTTPVQTGMTATGLAAGTYTVTVKDANSCSVTSAFTITEAQAVTAPTGASTQTFDAGDTLSVLVVNGQNIKWYSTAADANNHVNALPISTIIVNNTTYYATQTIGGCESKASLPVRARSEVLNVSDLNGKDKIQIYPNPVKESMYFNGDVKISKVVIMSIDGKRVFEKSLNGERKLNIHTLIQGVYLIKIFTDNGVQTIKFIKN